MNSTFILSTVLVLLASQGSYAQNLLCTGTMNQGVTTVTAVVTADKTANVSIAHKDYQENLVLQYSKSENEFSASEGICTDQYNGGNDYVLQLNGNTARFSHFWCDDDGGTGEIHADLNCLPNN